MNGTTAFSQNIIPQLRQNPSQLILQYQSFIKRVVYGFVKSSAISASEAMDYLQVVNVKLLQKLQAKKFENYSIQTSFKVFLGVVVKNIIKNELRAQQLRKTQSLEQIAVHSFQNYAQARQPYQNLQWEQALRKLSLILRIFRPKDRSKLGLSLQVIYRIPLTATKLQGLYPDATREEIEEVLTYFGGAYWQLSKANLWAYLTEACNVLEGKNGQSDALRKWYAKRHKVIVHNLFKKCAPMDAQQLDACFEHLLYRYYGSDVD